MRRTSIITIVLLVIVIIGLTGALVYTNLPASEETQSETAQNSQSQSDTSSDTTVTETPTEVSLESQLVQDMANLVGPYLNEDFFFDFLGDAKTVDDFSNSERLEIAYKLYVQDRVSGENGSYYFSKELMDEAMMSIFGITDYEPETFSVLVEARFEYDASTQTFSQGVGGGGGGPYGTWAITGIYSVEEYSDRYVAYSKYLIVTPSITNVTNDEGIYLGGIWQVRDSISFRSSVLGTYRDYESTENYSWVSYLGDYIADATQKSIVFAEHGPALTTYYKEIMYKYYDDATEYKHTFMKNEDGTYYWAKTEIVK